MCDEWEPQFSGDVATRLQFLKPVPFTHKGCEALSIGSIQ